MFYRLAAMTFAIAAGVHLLVVQDTEMVSAPPGGDTTGARAPDSAIGLLGERWTIAAPDPVAAPVPRPAASVRPETVRPQTALSEAAGPVPHMADAFAQAEPAVTSMRPVPRPGRLVATVATSGMGPSATPVPPRVVEVGDAGRWVVRRQGSGDVVAVLPLSEALALLEARSGRP